MQNRPSSNETVAPQGERYLTLNEVSAKLGGRSRSAIYADMAAGRYDRGQTLWHSNG